MITVRFPSGFSVQYNDLNWVEWGNGDAYLYTDSKRIGGWKVWVPKDSGAIVEFIPPCRAYQAMDKESEDRMMRVFESELRGLKRKISEALKGKKRQSKPAGQEK